MQPVSVVDNSNYHLLGNQLKGESHASRMARVHAMQRGQVGPTLQPLGSISASLSSPFLMAGLIGLGVGALNDKPTGSPKSMKSGKKGATKAAAVAAISTLALQLGDVDALSNSEWNLPVIGPIQIAGPQAIVIITMAAMAGGVMHGVGRTARWTLFP
jgi:hypothetical protein